jgi:hypothetical protein
MALDNHELICLIFCDVSKAFDRVWLRGLLLKLKRYGIKGNLLQWLGSYISAREQHIMPFVSSTLKSFEKYSATGNFNHQILPYGKLFLTFISTNVFYLLSFKFSR